MAKMTEMPYEHLCYIILLLVQSPGGAADFARIISVCRNFFLFAQDERILKHVNFDFRIELTNFKQYQHINSLLVKCAEVGNIAAQFLLGKVILVSSSQLLLNGWQKAECDIHPCNFSKLNESSCFLPKNVPAQDYEVGSFVSYFLPKQVSNSKSSQTRLVHFQLVKLFLLNGSHHDFAEMSVFLRDYIEFFTSISEEDSYLINSVTYLGLYANSMISFENHLMEVRLQSAHCEGTSYAISEIMDGLESTLARFRAQALHFFELKLG